MEDHIHCHQCHLQIEINEQDIESGRALYNTASIIAPAVGENRQITFGTIQVPICDTCLQDVAAEIEKFKKMSTLHVPDASERLAYGGK